MKALIFDLQGTLLENGVQPSPIKQVRYLLRIQQQFSDFVKKFEEAMMTGRFDTLKDAFLAVGEAFDLQINDYQMERLIGMWNKNKLLSRPFPESIEVLQQLKKSYKLCLIANCDCFTKDVIDKYGLGEFFDAVVLSCDVGLLKHDPAFFKKALDALGVDAEDAIVIGDSIESDMHGAEQAGIKGLLLDRRGTRQFDPSIRTLDEIDELVQEL